MGEVSLAAAGEWEAAIAAAQKAFVTLKSFSSLERQQMLEKLAAGVKARQEAGTRKRGQNLILN